MVEERAERASRNRRRTGIAYALSLVLVVAACIAWGEATGYPDRVLGPVIAWIGLGGVWSAWAIRTDRERLFGLPLSLLALSELLHWPDWVARAFVAALGIAVFLFGGWVTLHEG